MTSQFLFITLLIRLALKNKNNRGDNGNPCDNPTFSKNFGIEIWPFIIMVADLLGQKSCIYYI